MKPSILHVITTIDRGGAENHLLELARVQVKTGHKVTVAYLKGAAEQKENFQSAGIEVIQGGKSFFAQFAKIHKLARSGLYPIVHAHLPQAELACLGIPNHIISRHNTEPFVPGVPIGAVTSVDNAAGAVTQTADVKLYAYFSALSVVAVVVGAPKTDPRDALVPKAPAPTPVPTVTIYATPSESPTP